MLEAGVYLVFAYASILLSFNVHKLAAWRFQTTGSSTRLATNAELLDELQVAIGVAAGNVAQQTAALANEL